MRLLLAVVVALCLVGAQAPWSSGRSASRLRSVGAGPGAERPGAAVPELDLLVVLDLLDAAISSGASLPRALSAVGGVVSGPEGEHGSAGIGPVLVRAASALTLGAAWDAAWLAAPERLDPVIRALAPTWLAGVAPGPALRATADRVRRERRTAAREAAGTLGVRLVLPLGLCFLPAFVLIGLVPVIVSLAGGLLG